MMTSFLAKAKQFVTPSPRIVNPRTIIPQDDWPMWLTVAHEQALEGVSEVPGPRYHPQIAAYFQSLTNPNQFKLSDETPWCAAFVNWCLAQAGADRSHSPLARSFMTVGKDVLPPIAQEGDVAVFFSTKNNINGHVGFYICHSKDKQSVLILGGNQNNSVCYQWYSVKGQQLTLQSIRRITV